MRQLQLSSTFTTVNYKNNPVENSFIFCWSLLNIGERLPNFHSPVQQPAREGVTGKEQTGAISSLFRVKVLYGHESSRYRIIGKQLSGLRITTNVARLRTLFHFYVRELAVGVLLIYGRTRGEYISHLRPAFINARRELHGFWPTVLSVEPMLQCLVCLSVVCLSVTFCIVAKRCVLAKKCLKE